jgi:hypothetical protein
MKCEVGKCHAEGLNSKAARRSYAAARRKENADIAERQQRCSATGQSETEKRAIKQSVRNAHSAGIPARISVSSIARKIPMYESSRAWRIAATDPFGRPSLMIATAKEQLSCENCGRMTINRFGQYYLNEKGEFDSIVEDGLSFCSQLCRKFYLQKPAEREE